MSSAAVMNIANLAELLHETSEHHDPYEKSAPEHHWWDWYAAYMGAREVGKTSDEASVAAGRYVAGLRDAVPR